MGLNTLEAIRKARQVYVIGNGGSFANAAHIANDLLSKGIPAFTLDAAFLTATANDHGYENIYSRWLRVIAREGDVLIALSGSGTSKNILNGIKVAEAAGLKVIKLFGAQEGMGMQRAEEYQIMWGHEQWSKL